MAKSRKYRYKVHLPDRDGSEAKYAVEVDALIPMPPNETNIGFVI